MQIAQIEPTAVESATEPAEVAENSNTKVDNIGQNDHNIDPIIVRDVENINLKSLEISSSENINLRRGASVASQGAAPRKVKKRRRRRNRYDGFRVRRINCDLREAGIRNGDVVNTVNGQTVQSIPEAIVLWFKVRRRDRVVLEITRRGQPLTISYDLT
jgi:hypothetical protein